MISAISSVLLAMISAALNSRLARSAGVVAAQVANAACAAEIAPAMPGLNRGQWSMAIISCERARMKPTSSGWPWGKRA